MREFGRVGFPEGSTPTIINILKLYHLYCYNLIGVFVIVPFFIGVCAFMLPHQGYCSAFRSQALECIWVRIPIRILVGLLVPMYKRVVFMDECVDPMFSVKVVGSQ